MPKITEPVMGTPFLESFKKLGLWEEASRGTVFDGVEDVNFAVISLINPDTCVTDAQMIHMRTLIHMTSMDDSARKMGPGEESAVLATRIATFMNSIRLDCFNCLNKNCERRDPTLSSE